MGLMSWKTCRCSSGNEGCITALGFQRLPLGIGWNIHNNDKTFDQFGKGRCSGFARKPANLIQLVKNANPRFVGGQKAKKCGLLQLVVVTICTARTGSAGNLGSTGFSSD